MKLVFIATFSVILLVVCESQQDVIGDGDARGLYYNFEKRYGWNVDNMHDENHRYEEVNRSYSLDRGRDSKKEYDSREQSERRNPDHGQRLHHGRYNEDDSRETNRNSGRGERLDRGRDNKDNYDSREQTYHRDSDRNRDENNRQRNDRHRDRHNESSENQRGNRYPERRNHNTKDNDENQRNDRQDDKNYKKGYDNVDNRDDKHRDDSKNRDYSREDQKNNKNQDKHRNKDHGYENKKDNKSRERNNERDRNQGYGNEYRANDNNKNRNTEMNNNGRQYQKENDQHRPVISQEHGFERQDKDKNNKYDNGNYNYGSSNNQDKKEKKYYESDNSRHQEGQQGNLHKEKEVYGRLPENYVQKADYDYKEQDKYGRKQNTHVITEGSKDNKKDDRNPPYRYSYLESLITSPIQNTGRPNTEPTQENKNRKDEFQDYPRKQDQEKKNKEELIEIHGIISKNKDLNDKEVKVDVIVKKNHDTQGAIHESVRNLDHKQVNLEGGIHIHKVLNKVPEKDSKTQKPQDGNKHENDNVGYGQGNNNEKNYRAGYNNHIQGKKDLLGGIELLGLIGSIGQEIKEQVIERIPGYHLIQNLEHRGQKSGSKQTYNYNIDKNGPKIDLEVYSPDLKQIEEKEKKVEKIQAYSEISNKGKGIKIIKDKEIDIYANTKDKERKENVYKQGGRKAGYDYSISHKPVNLVDKYTKNQDYEYPVKIDEGQKEREYYNYGNVNQKDQENYNQQNSGIQSPNYLNQRSRDEQGLGYYNQRVTGYQGVGYVNQNNRGYINQDLGEYQGQGYWNQQDKINQVQDHKNKQKEEKYVFQYTIGKNLEAEQGSGKQGQINYNIPYFLPYEDSSRGLNNKQGDGYIQGLENRGEDDRKYYNLRYDYSNDKSDYETKPNEGWTYQGFQVNHPKNSKVEEKYNYIGYNNKDGTDAQGNIHIGNHGQVYRNQQVTEVNNGYPDLSYINKGNPDYTPKYNQGIIGSGYDVYQPQHYAIPELVNPLSQQILGSVGKVQDYYNQNYTKSLSSWSKQNAGYNVNPYVGDYSYSEPDYYNNYQQSYAKPGYDTSYQGSNKEYMYQYQLPYNNVFARIGLPY